MSILGSAERTSFSVFPRRLIASIRADDVLHQQDRSESPNQCDCVCARLVDVRSPTMEPATIKLLSIPLRSAIITSSEKYWFRRQAVC